jgi:DNA-directed RNA polymerase III subunit RPC6
MNILSSIRPEQLMVYQVCEKAGNRGIWTRDIKLATNIPQHTLTKTLKILEQRNLIKSVRSVISKSKKLYMLYDMQPAKEITGGPWYTEQEFDHEFVEELCSYIVDIVSRKGGWVDVASVDAMVKVSGISKVELSQEELELVLQTLVFDGRLEEVREGTARSFLP